MLTSRGGREQGSTSTEIIELMLDNVVRMRDAPHRFIDVNTWGPAGGAVRGGAALGMKYITEGWTSSVCLYHCPTFSLFCFLVFL